MSERAFRVSYRIGNYITEFSECEYQDSWEDAIWSYVRHVAKGNHAAIFVYDENDDDYRRIDDETLYQIYTMARQGVKEAKIAKSIQPKFETED